MTASLFKSPGLFSVLRTVLNNAVVWMVSTRPPTPKSSRPFNNPLATVPKAPITLLVLLYSSRVFHIRFPQFSRTLLSILADLNNAEVWMVSNRPVISKSSSPCTSPFVSVPRAPSTIGINVAYMFRSFFNSLARSR